MGSEPPEPGDAESFGSHLRQLDHWTFLLALGFVIANIFVGSPYLSAGAAVLLLVALAYDAWEFYDDG
ncbi:hypothetical protein GRX03_14630 [Halovenus sp. WSH3]|uniref:Uncharacterized protein n=1 Tax=Halovenus carboxidivorans TaxID=2692199 RepID=A0A6B0T7B2_9EURY|nr:hypothetical protein [Halovenus carboxidivorans]MXR52837.1 hypothetical protein [Halovenus carboxidivorans]